MVDCTGTDEELYGTKKRKRHYFEGNCEIKLGRTRRPHEEKSVGDETK
jgi:hypothetical protein